MAKQQRRNKRVLLVTGVLGVVFIAAIVRYRRELAAWYEFRQTFASLEKSPMCTSGSGDRVIRGGSWCDGARSCRSASRIGIRPSDRSFHLGFRPLQAVTL